MKKKCLLGILCLMAICSFSACSSDDDELDKTSVNDYKDLFEDYQFTVNESNGICMAQGTSVGVSGNMMNDYVIGHAWKCIAAHKLQADGTLSHKNFYDDVLGMRSSDLWFDNSKQLTVLTLNDKATSYNPIQHTYSYNPNNGILVYNPEASDDLTSRYLQLFHLKYVSQNEIYLYATQLLYYTSNKDGIKSTYGISVYKRDDSIIER